MSPNRSACGPRSGQAAGPDALTAIARKLDGSRAAANTIARKRAVLSNVLDFAVGRGLDVNPLPRVAGIWTSPKTTEGVVDPQVVVNRRQAEDLLIAVSYQGRMGPQLIAFFACLYFAGLRPAEAVELRMDRSLELPDDGWGTLYLRESAPTVGSVWSASGRRRDPRQLKHRAAEEVRPVPCHPALTWYIHGHIEQFGTAPDGRPHSSRLMIEALASEQVASIPAADSSSENDHNVVQENETTADPVVRAAHGPAVE